MGRIVVSEFVTLDGVIDDPGGAEKSPHGGWAFKFDRGPEGDKFKSDELFAADALLLGRATYDEFAAAWPSRDDNPFGQKMNAIPKYVVSSTLREATWNNSTVLSGDPAAAIARLRDEAGEILVAGSRRLVGLLRAHDLVDEWRLMVFPIVIGGGTRLFEHPSDESSLKLVDVRLAGDTAILTYHRAALD